MTGEVGGRCFGHLLSFLFCSYFSICFNTTDNLFRMDLVPFLSTGCSACELGNRLFHYGILAIQISEDDKQIMSILVLIVDWRGPHAGFLRS